MKLKDLDAYCAQWPGVSLDVKWGKDRIYSVGLKMFAGTDAESPLIRAISFKVADEHFLVTEMPGIVPAPYMARHHWI